MEVAKKIEEYIAHADFLPPSFQLLPRLLKLLNEVDASADTLTELVQMDAGLSANILRACNSAAYGATYRVETIQDAVMRLGFRQVHRIVMTIVTSPAMKGELPPGTRPEPDLWKHSLASAVASEQVVEGTEVDSEVAYTAALLHDVGKIVLARAVPEEYAVALAQARQENKAAYEVERKMLRTDHGAVGARLLQRWGFPTSIYASIQFHHEPLIARDEVKLASCLYTANVLAYLITERSAFSRYVVSPDPRALGEMGYTQAGLHAMVMPAQKKFQKYLEHFR